MIQEYATFGLYVFFVQIKNGIVSQSVRVVIPPIADVRKISCVWSGIRWSFCSVPYTVDDCQNFPTKTFKFVQKYAFYSRTHNCTQCGMCTRISRCIIPNVTIQCAYKFRNLFFRNSNGFCKRCRITQSLQSLQLTPNSVISLRALQNSVNRSHKILVINPIRLFPTLTAFPIPIIAAITRHAVAVQTLLLF